MFLNNIRFTLSTGFWLRNWLGCCKCTDSLILKIHSKSKTYLDHGTMVRYSGSPYYRKCSSECQEESVPRRILLVLDGTSWWSPPPVWLRQVLVPCFLPGQHHTHYVEILVISGLPLKEAQSSPVRWALTWRIFFCHDRDQAAQPYQHYPQYQAL